MTWSWKASLAVAMTFSSIVSVMSSAKTTVLLNLSPLFPVMLDALVCSLARLLLDSREDDRCGRRQAYSSERQGTFSTFQDQKSALASCVSGHRARMPSQHVHACARLSKSTGPASTIPDRTSATRVTPMVVSRCLTGSRIEGQFVATRNQRGLVTGRPQVVKRGMLVRTLAPSDIVWGSQRAHQMQTRYEQHTERRYRALDRKRTERPLPASRHTAPAHTAPHTCRSRQNALAIHQLVCESDRRGFLALFSDCMLLRIEPF